MILMKRRRRYRRSAVRHGDYKDGWWKINVGGMGYMNSGVISAANDVLGICQIRARNRALASH